MSTIGKKTRKGSGSSAKELPQEEPLSPSVALEEAISRLPPAKDKSKKDEGKASPRSNYPPRVGYGQPSFFTVTTGKHITFEQ